MVAPFLKRYPDINLEIVADSSLIDIVSDGFDAGIRYEETLAQDMVAISLGPPERYALVAAPRFLKGRKRPTHPNELLGAAVHRHALSQRRAACRGNSGKGSATSRSSRPARSPRHTRSCRLQAAIDGVGFLHDARGLRAGGHCLWAARQPARRLVAAFPRPVPVLPGPATAAGEPAAFVAFVREFRKERITATHRVVPRSRTASA